MQANATDLLSSFSGPLQVLLIGASGGIGSAITTQLLSQAKVAKLIALSRREIQVAHPKLSTGYIDITDEASIIAATQALDVEHLDMVLVMSGILHAQGLAPEKSLRELSLGNFQQIFAVNAFGPALVFKHLLQYLPRDRRSILAALSARVGSIGDNQLGGWYSYRASKAALNMVIKCASIEIGRHRKQACVIGLHPGTVDTALSAPFQARIKPGQLFTAEQAATYLLQVINQVSVADSGNTFAWDGQVIPC